MLRIATIDDQVASGAEAQGQLCETVNDLQPPDERAANCFNLLADDDVRNIFALASAMINVPARRDRRFRKE